MKIFNYYKNIYKENKFIFLFMFIRSIITIIVLFYISYVLLKKIININLEFSNVILVLQAIGGLGSAIIAIYAIVISKKFNKFIKQQNDISLEEFRPKIVSDFNGGIGIKNDGSIEANEVDIYLKLLDEKIIKIEKNLIINPGKFLRINLGDNSGFFSIIVKYKNYGSDIYYLYGFNYQSGKEIFNIGENYSSKINGKYYNTPILENDYLNLFNTFSIKNQIINNKDVLTDFNNFIERY